MNEQVKTMARFAGVAVFGGTAAVLWVYAVYIAYFTAFGDSIDTELPDGFFYGVSAVAALIAAVAACAAWVAGSADATLRARLMGLPCASITVLALVWFSWGLFVGGNALGVLAVAGAAAGCASYVVLLADASARRHAHA